MVLVAKAAERHGIPTWSCTRDGSLAGIMAIADAQAPKHASLVIRSDRTSDGTFWGPGLGRILAQRNHGRWLVE